jgi:hypothetical protein
MRVAWKEGKKQQGVTLLDLSHYSYDEDETHLLAHVRRGEVLAIPIDDPAAKCIIDWWEFHYQLEQQQLREAIAAATGGA